MTNSSTSPTQKNHTRSANAPRDIDPHRYRMPVQKIARLIDYLSPHMLPYMIICTLGVTFLSFAIPAIGTLKDISHSPYSVAKGNFMALTGDPRNLAADIYAEAPQARGILAEVSKADPENIGKTYENFSPHNVPQELLSGDEESTVAELSDSEEELSLNYYQSLPRTSTIRLPFGLPPSTPYTGDYGAGTINPDSQLITGWYRLPKIDADHPLLILSAAGDTSSITAEFAEKTDGKVSTPYRFYDPFPGEKWRNIILDLRTISGNPKFVRINIGESSSLIWTVVTAPRVPVLITLADLINHDPVLIDWTSGLGFPTLQPFSIAHGIQTPPQWRITADRSLFNTTSDWESAAGGGPLGLIAGYAKAIDWPTYTLNPLGKNYIALEKYIPYSSMGQVMLPDNSILEIQQVNRR